LTETAVARPVTSAPDPLPLTAMLSSPFVPLTTTLSTAPSPDLEDFAVEILPLER
jgi:hypothetical protein